jgi:2-polyprenyl-6-methoxyphenol hydroxylase-like FAD-dependent oxidoreductase
VIVAGAGPAGVTTALGLHAADDLVRVFEARGSVATRARNIFLRPQARGILRDVGLGDPGRDTTIMSLENGLRRIAGVRGVPFEYERRVLDVVEHPDHVAVTVSGVDGGAAETIRARAFVDASGGRIAATQAGAFERVPTGPHHAYVTAQYDTPAHFNRVYGAFDRGSKESIFFFPVSDGTGFVAYYDVPPGVGITDEAALLARYDTVAGHLQLGTPVTPPQAFDAQQHLSRSAASGRIIKVGDSAGNADPYIGAGVAAALVDARAAVRALTTPGDTARQLSQAAQDVLTGHRHLGRQAKLMIRVRDYAMRFLPKAHFDERLSPQDLGQSRVLDAVANTLTNLPIIT